MKSLIDFHCHLDLLKDTKKVVSELENSPIYVLSMTNTPKIWSVCNQMFKNNPKVKIALGLHPQLIKDRYNEISIFESLLRETNYVGEVGIDGSKEFAETLELQKSIFGRILSGCSQNGGRIISIHSKNAAKHVLDIIEDHKSAGSFVLHWFTGTKAELKRAIDLECWFSINSMMLSSAKGIELIKLMPKDKILTETDIPFSYDNGVSQHKQILNTLDMLSKELGILDADRLIYENFKKLICNHNHKG